MARRPPQSPHWGTVRDQIRSARTQRYPSRVSASRFAMACAVALASIAALVATVGPSWALATTPTVTTEPRLVISPARGRPGTLITLRLQGPATATWSASLATYVQSHVRKGWQNLYLLFPAPVLRDSSPTVAPLSAPYAAVLIPGSRPLKLVVPALPAGRYRILRKYVTSVGPVVLTAPLQIGRCPKGSRPVYVAAPASPTAAAEAGSLGTPTCAG